MRWHLIGANGAFLDVAVADMSVLLSVSVGNVPIGRSVPIGGDMSVGDGMSIGGGMPVADGVSVGRGRVDLLATSVAIVLFQVGMVEEVAEEQKVGEVDGEREVEVLVGLLTRAALVLESVVADGDGDAEDHLGDLEGGDEHGDMLGEAQVERAQRVVGIHESVNGVVHPDEPASTGGVVLVSVPGVHEDSDVMIPVEEDKRSFAFKQSTIHLNGSVCNKRTHQERKTGKKQESNT